MCKFLLELFAKHQQQQTTPTATTVVTTTSTVTNTTGTTGSTVVVTPEPVDVGDNNNNNHIDNTPTAMEKNRYEIEQKVIQFAKDMAKGSARKVNQIAVHCTATIEGTPVSIEDIDRWHKQRGFTKQKISGHYCGYHFVVALDGTIMCGRDLREVGAHVSGYNTPSIGVCYVGGLDSAGKAKDTRTPEQKEAMVWLIGLLKHTLNISKVQGHRDYSPDKNGNGIIERFEWIKDCPCFNAIPEYKNL